MYLMPSQGGAKMWRIIERINPYILSSQIVSNSRQILKVLFIVICLLWVGCAPKTKVQDSDWANLNRQVVLLYTQGHYDSAVPIAQQALLVAKAQYGLAQIFAETGQTDKAISAFEKLREISRNFAEIDYNLACLYAKQSRIKQATDHLKKAIQGGYNKWNTIRSDKDLDNIRDTSEYRQLLKRHGE